MKPGLQSRRGGWNCFGGNSKAAGRPCCLVLGTMVCCKSQAAHLEPVVNAPTEQVLLADRCSPDTSHRKLPLPMLLLLLPLLLVAILWVVCLLTATIYALQLLEQLLEVLDPTPPDQFRDHSEQAGRLLFADTSTARLTRSGSFCCGWLWATNGGTLAREKRPSLLRRVQRFFSACRRRLQLLLAQSSTATLLQQAAALWRGIPLRRGSPPQLRRVSLAHKRAYYFVLARDELVWHTTEAASCRGAGPAGRIRLDSIVEAPPTPPPHTSSPPLLPTPPPFSLARCMGRCWCSLRSHPSWWPRGCLRTVPSPC